MDRAGSLPAPCRRYSRGLPSAPEILQGASDAFEWQDTAAQAVGLLWDYAIVTKDRYPDRSLRDLFRDFATSLATGTIQTDASDATGLFWPATPYARCKGLIKAIEGFATWCDCEEPGSSPIAPVIVPLVPHTGDHVTAMLRCSSK